ncbi:EFR1 family ferrodoxin [Ruminococcaceae bacterium OttesenSCG-928-N02]|nr:EFR1 family ferrodoxin [Ruminococcaceae bacterium OttesenSCG-928-N02]
MNVTLCYFSATDTTRKTVRTIAQGMGATAPVELDYTMPDARAKTPAPFTAEDFVVFGAPVYSGLLPFFCLSYLENVKGNGTPCAIAGVYGNRHYDDCLVEMEDLLTKNGFKVVAAGAFLGEHSFSADIAPGRPDATDLRAAEAFGQQVAQKMAAGGQALAQGVIPGARPYKERAPRAATVPPTVSDACIDCKMCANSCPMGAISMDDVSVIDGNKCVRCLRCVRVCPTGAINFTDEGFAKVKAYCEGAFMNPRREAEVFI